MRKRLTRRQLRRILLREIRLLTEEAQFTQAMNYSKANPSKKVYYYDAKDNLVQVLEKGVIEDTIQNVEPGSKEYKKLAFSRGNSKTFGFA